MAKQANKELFDDLQDVDKPKAPKLSVQSSGLLWLGTVVCVLVSLTASFFVVFNVVFSDVFDTYERFLTYVYAGVAYFILGLVTGAIGPGKVNRWVWIYSVPALGILGLYTFQEPQNLLIHLGFAVLVPLATYVGARGGAWARGKKK